jgi:hypothetical protein
LDSALTGAAIMELKDVLLTIGGGALVFLSLWIYYVMTTAHNSSKELWKEFNAHKQQFSDYKLYASREFASENHLKEVEDRMVKALEGINDKLDKLVDAFHAHVLWEQNMYKDRSK